MKRFTLTMMMFAGLLTACSTDDQMVLVNEENVGLNDSNVGSDDNNIGILSNPPAEMCADAPALGGTATLSSYTGPQITFNWNNAVEYDTDKTYVSHIEISEDPACPAPAGAIPVPAAYPIDVFNTSSLVVPAGVSAKCFYWRIVINGYTGPVVDCTTTTDWKPATYVQ